MSERDSERVLPLSAGQHWMLRLTRLRPPAMFNITLAFDVEEQAAPHLAGALMALAARHEALRTRIGKRDHRYVQLVSDVPEVRLVEVAVDDGTVAPTAQAVMAEPIGIDGLLWSAHLLRSPRKVVLLVVLHHLVADGWSLGVIARDLRKLAVARVEGREDALQPLDTQYSDLIRNETRALDETRRAALRRYWSERLAGARALELRTGVPGAAARQAKVVHVESVVTPAVWDRAEVLARRRRCTVFTVLYGAFVAMLSDETGQKDTLVTTELVNRSVKGAEHVVGFFSKTVLLRCDTGGGTFDELLGRAREVVFGAHSNSDVPFAQLLAERPEMFAPNRPWVIFQMAMDEYGSSPLEGPLVPLATPPGVSAGHIPALADLLVIISGRRNRVVTMTTSSHLFEEGRVRELLDRYLEMLDAATAAPEKQLQALGQREAAQ